MLESYTSSISTCLVRIVYDSYVILHLIVKLGLSTSYRVVLYVHVLYVWIGLIGDSEEDVVCSRTFPFPNGLKKLY